MENENTGAVPDTAKEVTPEVITADEVVEENIEDVKAQLEKERNLAQNYKQRAEKAERKAKDTPDRKESKVEITSKDTIALINAKVHEDDIDEVIDFAKFKGISVSDALKNSMIKTLLDEKLEQRNTADATNTTNSRRGATKASDEVLLSKSSKGDVPDNDADMARLIKIKMGIK